MPTTTAAPDGAEYVLTGTKYLVPAATVATAFLVPATTPDGTAVFLVDADTAGLQVREQHLSDGDVVGLIELDGVRVAADRRVGTDEVRPPSAWWTCSPSRRCAVQLGVTEGAIALTAEYAKTREQFDRPIGTFQAVSQRLADGYIDTRFQALTRVAGRMAARRGPSRRGGHRHGQALGRGRRPPDRPHDRAHPRRRGRRPATARPTATSPRPRATSSSTAARRNRRCASAGSWPPNRRDDPGPAPRPSRAGHPGTADPRPRRGPGASSSPTPRPGPLRSRACSTRSALPMSGC